MNVIDFEGQETSVQFLESFKLLRELLELQLIVLLLLVLLEHQDLGFTNVQGWRLWIIVGGYVVVPGEALVDLAPQVEAAVLVTGAQPEVLEATHVPDLIEDYIRVCLGHPWSVRWRHFKM